MPFSSQPWRATGYLAVRMLVPGVTAGLLAIAFSSGVLAGIGLALPIVAIYLVVTVATAGTERRAVTLLGQPEIPDPHGTDDRGLLPAIGRRLRAAATWREVAHGATRA